LIHQQRSDQRNAKQKKKHNRVVSTYFSRTQCERFQVFNRVLSFQGGSQGSKVARDQVWVSTSPWL
jgi:hypothetical protein